MSSDAKLTMVSILLCGILIFGGAGCSSVIPLISKAVGGPAPAVQAEVVVGKKQQSVEVGKAVTSLAVDSEQIGTIEQNRNTDQQAGTINNTNTDPAWVWVLIIAVMAGTIGWMVELTPQEICRRIFKRFKKA